MWVSQSHLWALSGLWVGNVYPHLKSIWWAFQDWLCWRDWENMHCSHRKLSLGTHQLCDPSPFFLFSRCTPRTFSVAIEALCKLTFTTLSLLSQWGAVSLLLVNTRSVILYSPVGVIWGNPGQKHSTWSHNILGYYNNKENNI